jgi:hypothetical protein
MAEHNADQVTKKGQSGELWVVHQARLDARLATAIPCFGSSKRR